MIMNVEDKELKTLTDMMYAQIPETELKDVIDSNKYFRSLNNTGIRSEAKGFSKSKQLKATLGLPPTFYYLLQKFIPGFFNHIDPNVRTARLNFIKRNYPQFSKEA